MPPERVYALVLFVSFWTGLSCAQPAAPAPDRRNAAVGLSAFEKWLDEDVAYIIALQERADALRLQTGSQRDEFVVQFWLRRDPTPGTAKNEFKEEHYRRLAYANEHFASRIPGWKTDRGRIYITYGPPDQIEAHPGYAGKAGSEVWRYRFIEGIGASLAYGFTDRNGNGDYVLTSEPPQRSPRRP
jgi:GWxTD domain-containing protein